MEDIGTTKPHFQKKIDYQMTGQEILEFIRKRLERDDEKADYEKFTEHTKPIHKKTNAVKTKVQITEVAVATRVGKTVKTTNNKPTIGTKIGHRDNKSGPARTKSPKKTKAKEKEREKAKAKEKVTHHGKTMAIGKLKEHGKIPDRGLKAKELGKRHNLTTMAKAKVLEKVKAREKPTPTHTTHHPLPHLPNTGPILQRHHKPVIPRSTTWTPNTIVAIAVTTAHPTNTTSFIVKNGSMRPLVQT